MTTPQRFSLRQHDHEFVIYDAEKGLPPTPFHSKPVALVMLSQLSQIFAPRGNVSDTQQKSVRTITSSQKVSCACCGVSVQRCYESEAHGKLCLICFRVSKLLDGVDSFPHSIIEAGYVTMRQALFFGVVVTHEADQSLVERRLNAQALQDELDLFG